ncbi:MAG: extracellular solute-binding protein, partial [Treponema sp.]|nr:extracellular solute-binding protein [Treponema sp.]
MKKIILVLLLAFAVCTVISASGTGQGSAADLGAPVSLVLWTHEDPNRSILEKNFVEQFRAANPNVSIDYQQYPSGQMRELLTAAFSANQGPNIFNQSQSVIRQFVLEGRTEALDPAWIGERSINNVIGRYLPGALEAVELGGKIYGLPLEYTNHCMYLNKKIFRDAGLNPDTDYPKTWEDVMTISEKLVQRNGEIVTRRGFDFRYPEYTSSFLPMVIQLGGQLVSDDG